MGLRPRDRHRSPDLGEEMLPCVAGAGSLRCGVPAARNPGLAQKEGRGLAEKECTMADTVKIGVTGHRFLAEVEKLEAAARQAVDMIERAFPSRRLAAVSPLAEGADRLVARIVLEREAAALIVPLPLPREDYLQDFATPESRAEFEELLGRAAQVLQLPPAPTREEAYEQVGQYVVDHSDVLIALWDGQGAQGQGGTADMVYRALERGMPVFHIKAGNRRPGTTEPTTLGPEQGRLVVHNLPDSARA